MARRPSGFRVVHAYPHDPTAFTEGLVLVDGELDEGTGPFGSPSTVRLVDLETGAVRRSRELPVPQFGEGIAVLGNRVWQLTWRSQIGCVLDRETFAEVDTFSYAGEGWGLTTIGKRLVVSNGTAHLSFCDRPSFAEVRRVTVRDNGKPVTAVSTSSRRSTASSGPTSGRPTASCASTRRADASPAGST